ncbi:unnamed protein product [Oikopleura dioica]|uniref:RING-type domain-containing protein n=1 Tax=Oikopleura dioica TaxID=34765 RepID=E4YHL8_OIKDI|nr:unnamed protein product [Oikopleura dioica]
MPKIIKEFVADGKGCDSCESFTESMIFIGPKTSSKKYCEECVPEDDNTKEIKFVPCDAQFKCPEDHCGTELSSFREHTLGKCCSYASEENYTDDKYVYQKKVADRFDAAKRAEEVAGKEYRKAKLIAENAESKFNCFRAIRKNYQDAMATAFCEAAKDLEQMKIKEDMDEKLCCKVCFEVYDQNERKESAPTACGHKSCLKCLKSLPSKNCPTCRKDFEEIMIIF